MNRPIQTILIVDDSPDDRIIFRRLLEKNAENEFVFIEAENGTQALEFCRTEFFDCILLDFRLPDFNADEVLMAIEREHGANAFPVVVISGSESVEDVVLSLRYGAHDYLIKNRTTWLDLNRAMENAIEKVSLYRKQKRDGAEAYRLASIVESSEDAIISKDFSGTILSWNKGAEHIFGYTVEEIVGGNITILFPPELLAEEAEILAEIKSGKSIQHYETVRRRKDGSDVEISLTISPIKNAAGEIVGVSKIARDITGRKQTEAALIENEQRMRLATEATGVGVWEWNVITNRIRWDDQMFRIHGIEPTKDGFIEYNTWSETVLPDDLAEQEELLQDTVRRLGNGTREFRIRCQDGTDCRYVQSVETVRTNAEGQAEWVIGTNLDITERKRAEEIIRDSEAHLRRVLDNLFAFVGVIKPDGTIIEANAAPLEAAGIKLADVYGKKFWDCYWWNYDEQIQAQTRDAVEKAASGISSRFDIDVQVAGGNFLTIDYMIAPMRDDKGTITDLIASGVDISDRTRSEMRYRRLFEAAQDGIFIMDATTRKITDVNPFMIEFLDYTKEEFLGKELWEIGLLKDEEESAAAFRELQKNGDIRYENLPLKTKNGEIREVEFVSNVYTESDRQVIQCNIRDITERRRAEETLRESEMRYRTLFESIDEGFCLIEVLFDENEKANDYRFLEINPAFELLTGISADSALDGQTIRQLVPDIEEKWYEIYGRVALTGEPIRFEENSAAMNRWFDVYALRVGEPESRRVAVVFNNITERKRFEESMRLSEERYRLLFENNPFPMWVYDLKTLSFLAVNEAAVSHYGYSQEKFLSMTIKEIRPDEDIPDLLEDVKETDKKLNNAGVWRHRKKDGSIIHVEINSHTLMFDGNEARLVLANDITERLRAEESLREKEAQLYATDRRLADIVQGMTEACFALDADWRFNFINDQGEKLIRRSREEILGKTIWDVFIKLAGTPMEKNYRRTMNERIPMSFEAFSPIAGRWLDVRLFPSGDGLAAFLLDIDDRKKAEESLRFEKERFEKIADASPSLICSQRMSPDGDISFTYVSPAVNRLYGFSPQDVEADARVIFDRIYPEDSIFLTESIERSVLTMSVWHNIFRFEHPQKGEIWVEGFSAPVLEADGSVIWHGITNDVTERVEAENSIRELNESLEQKVGERTAELNAVNKELEAFSYSVSHDLRAPLRAMDGFSLALLEDYGEKFDAIGQNYLNRVRGASKQMARLIDDMLLLSRVTRSELVKTAVNLSEIVKAVAAELCENQPRENISFDIDENIQANGDGRLLKIALENLLGNAYKFTSKKADAKIIFGQRQNGGETEYFVKDNGAGFDMAYAGKLFGTFQRLHTTQEFEGTGIGLATVQRVIRKHGGNIRAEATVGEGACFYFTL